MIDAGDWNSDAPESRVALSADAGQSAWSTPEIMGCNGVANKSPRRRPHRRGDGTLILQRRCDARL